MIVTPVLISGDVVTEVEEPKAQRTQRLAFGQGSPSETPSEPESEEDEDDFYLDEFERSWAERWLNGVITRGEGWLAEVEPEEDEEAEDSASRPETEDGANLEQWEEYYAREQVLQDARAGAIMRELIFPVPESSTKPPCSIPTSPKARRRSTLTSSRPITLKLHDAAIDDHTAVGVQTWGSCILLGRMMSSDPKPFFDLPCLSEDGKASDRPIRMLELGAGTGLLSMLCHEILNKRKMVPLTDAPESASRAAEVIATDYHPLVLDNMRKCIDLNFPEDTLLDLETSNVALLADPVAGLGVMPLDWMTFPQQAERYHRSAMSRGGSSSNGVNTPESGHVAHQVSPYAADSIWKPAGSDDNQSSAGSDLINSHLVSPFDMILAADCVYDTAHAGMIRDCVKWSLRLPELDSSGNVVREGGVLHLLSPLRPTYAEETLSIAKAFPFIDALPPRYRRASRRQSPKFNRAQGIYNSGVATPVTPNGHKGSSIESILELDKLRFDKSKSSTKYLYDSGIATPTPESEMAKGAGLSVDKWVDEFDMGLGEKGGWVLCTKRRVELERMKGNGRSDEVEYWWWEIGWA
ncbi:hypothetical protein QFC20_000772 [Naganishia adeliensis]|uniref:Uncharacterized protein n=1 Tax=Naganishia adeliensis TaxID=92952 RepID=A0ACC2WYB6_9TREE|nr:hypothetical protein QFC20_000772 [Naganishia adeliensis]